MYQYFGDSMKRAIYPGSFDPITNGHLDIIQRASKLFDEVYVCVAINAVKKSYFDLEERVRMCQEACKNIPNVKIVSTSGLVVRKAKELGCDAIVRGLRAVTDFEFEFQLSASNEYIDNSIETVFFMSSNGKDFISSSNVKEFYFNDVDVASLVPDIVVEMFKNKK